MMLDMSSNNKKNVSERKYVKIVSRKSEIIKNGMESKK